MAWHPFCWLTDVEFKVQERPNVSVPVPDRWWLVTNPGLDGTVGEQGRVGVEGAVYGRMDIDAAIRHAINTLPEWPRDDAHVVRINLGADWKIKMNDGMGTYHAHVERDALFPGEGHTLKLVRRDGRGVAQELKGLEWVDLPEAMLPQQYIGDRDVGGDLCAFGQALMDAFWRAGVRPSSFCADKETAQGIIDVLEAHVESLQSQVKEQNKIIEKLLPK